MKRLLTIALTALVLVPAPATSQTPVNSADRLIFWTGCRVVAALTDAELDAWEDRGVDGFVCTHQHLRDMGGTQNFTADPNHPLSTSDYDLQRTIRDSGIVGRAHARGMKLYLSVYLVNYYNNATPLKDWFDDAGWSGTVLPKLGDVAGAARLLGFDGLAFDQELYGRPEGAQRWPWNYPGNSHTEAEVRAKARERGRQVMTQVLKAFPGVDLLTYHYNFAGDWNSIVQKRYNDLDDFGANALFIDWYSGLSSVEGYAAIRLINTNFHKVKAPAATWDIAMQYEANHLLSLFSRSFPNWSYAAGRVHPTPFSWIDAGPSATSTYDDAKPPAEVEVQLAAMRKWGTGGEFLNFSFQDIRSFDYSPYVAGMQKASSPGEVDSTPPKLAVSTPTGGSSTVDLTGVVTDDMAVRSVSWSDDRGHSGVARTTFRVLSGDYLTGYDWQVDWQATVPLTSGPNVVTVTVEDVKGLRTTSSVTVDGPPATVTTTTSTSLPTTTTTVAPTTTTTVATTTTTVPKTTTTTAPKKGKGRK
ncbi:MAG: hypothetical protein ACLGI2_04790 [Acidimicrobiia bacterium]